MCFRPGYSNRIWGSHLRAPEASIEGMKIILRTLFLILNFSLSIAKSSVKISSFGASHIFCPMPPWIVDPPLMCLNFSLKTFQYWFLIKNEKTDSEKIFYIIFFVQKVAFVRNKKAVIVCMEPSFWLLIQFWCSLFKHVIVFSLSKLARQLISGESEFNRLFHK